MRNQFLALAAFSVMAFGQAVHAQDADILNLYADTPWHYKQNGMERCDFRARFSDKFYITLILDRASQSLQLQMDSKQGFVDNTKVYQTDIYVDSLLSIGTQARPYTDKSIGFNVGAPEEFLSALEVAEEISLGLDDTLYVFNLNQGGLTPESVISCFGEGLPAGSSAAMPVPSYSPASSPASQSLAVEPVGSLRLEKEEPGFFGRMLSKINVFDGDDEREIQVVENYEPPLQPKVQMDVERLPLTPVDPYSMKSKSSAHKNDVYSLHQGLEKGVSSAGMPPSTGGDGIGAGDFGTDGGVEGASFEFGGDEAPQGRVVYDVDELDGDALPPEIRVVQPYMTDESNYDEEQELIDSLLVQLALLEREKEALREKVQEVPGPLSVIRSCRKEQDVIQNLYMKLESLESERFDLEQQKEIQADLLESCRVDETEPMQDFEFDNGDGLGGDDLSGLQSDEGNDLSGIDADDMASPEVPSEEFGAPDFDGSEGQESLLAPSDGTDSGFMQDMGEGSNAQGASQGGGASSDIDGESSFSGSGSTLDGDIQNITE